MPWMGIQDLWTFIIAVLLFLLLPGPGTFGLLAATGRDGLRGGFGLLFGLLAGDQVLMWLAVAGVAALLRANPMVFSVVQYLGAAYLIWVGIALLRQRRAASDDGGASVPAPPSGRYFRQGVLISLLNPKAIIFYMAFFPLFIDPQAHRGLATFATMAALIAILSLAYCSVLILVGNGLRRQFAQRPRVSAWARRIPGAFLIGFGLKLGISG